MATVGEILGYALGDQSPKANMSRLSYLCPFSGVVCTAGNRNVTVSVNLPGGTQRRRAGVCSVVDPKGEWMVCPNRLFAFDTAQASGIKTFGELAEPVQLVLGATGAWPLNAGPIGLGVWAEVRMAETSDGGVFDYRFDFVLQPVAEQSAEDFIRSWELSIRQAPLARRVLRNGRTGFCPFPVDGFPIVLEVMTASTQGSDTAKGTDIGSAFLAAWEVAVEGGAPRAVPCPGPNVRQVWGRMATQLVAKSEATESWGGKTVWVMQDLLLDALTRSTRISDPTDVSASTLPLSLNAANLLSLSYTNAQAEAGDPRPVQLHKLIAEPIPSVLNELGHRTIHGILHVPFVPPPSALALSLLRSPGLKAIIIG